MSEKTQTPDEKTALEWMSKRFPDSPRKRVKEWFMKGRIKLDGSILKKPHLKLTDPGERLIMGEAAAPALFAHMPMRVHAQLNLLYIDDSLAIVNKGAGLLSLAVPGNNQSNALSLLEKFLNGKGAGSMQKHTQNRKTLTPLPVHRLDKYTSGLLCFAMNESAREKLIKQVRDHSFLREYLAWGDGKLEKPRGKWQSWFKLDEEGMNQTVFQKETPGATEALSSYEVIEEISWPTKIKNQHHTVSRLRLRLTTGLKHQLRIHAAEAGVPLLGDRRYHPDFMKLAPGAKQVPYNCRRQALHASSLGFIHPETGKTRRFNCKLPKDLAELEASLRRKG